MTWGRVWWPVWIILTTCLFLGPEIYALVTNYRNTLSQYAWTELNVNPHIHVHTIAWFLSLAGFVLAVIVLIAHIWYHVD
jgi:hypothetical protein